MKKLLVISILVFGSLALAASAMAAPPKIVRAVMSDADNDGKADSVLLTWDQKINHARDIAAPFPLVVQGYAVKRVEGASRSKNLTVRIKEKAAPDPTANPNVSYKRTTSKPVRNIAGAQAAKQTFIYTFPLVAIYVATTGNDANPGTSRAAPKQNVQNAVSAASGAGADDIFIRVGSYSGGVVITGDNLSLTGGFNASWLRSTSATSISGAPQALFADNAVNLHLRSLSLAGSPTSHPSAYGIRAVNSSSLTLDAVKASAANANPGANGSPGGAGAGGAAGSNGAVPTFGNGGATFVAGGRGGSGGFGTADGSPGLAGASVLGGAAGTGGAGDSACTAGTTNGLPGSNGASGSSGADGGGGSNALSATSVNVWAGNAGSIGQAGQAGGGGGGGGGGNGLFGVLICASQSGGGGGGGGGGGQGGGGATGGSAGGGSFAIFLMSSSLFFNSGSAIAGNGGQGGAGAAGGSGGTGGNRGFGAAGASGTFASAGSGGNGGLGGNGGQGGSSGGGVGGPSVGIYAYGPSVVVKNDAKVTLGHGTGGAGGAGGAGGGTAGQTGQTANLVD